MFYHESRSDCCSSDSCPRCGSPFWNGSDCGSCGYPHLDMPTVPPPMAPPGMPGGF